jgi:hypothetical protein
LQQVTENIESLQKQKDDQRFLIDKRIKIKDDDDEPTAKVQEGREGKSKAYQQIKVLIDKNRKQKYLYMMLCVATE